MLHTKPQREPLIICQMLSSTAWSLQGLSREQGVNCEAFSRPHSPAMWLSPGQSHPFSSLCSSLFRTPWTHYSWGPFPLSGTLFPNHSPLVQLGLLWTERLSLITNLSHQPPSLSALSLFTAIIINWHYIKHQETIDFSVSLSFPFLFIISLCHCNISFMREWALVVFCDVECCAWHIIDFQ